jgi:hypothetical protein
MCKLLNSKILFSSTVCSIAVEPSPLTKEKKGGGGKATPKSRTLKRDKRKLSVEDSSESSDAPNNNTSSLVPSSNSTPASFTATSTFEKREGVSKSNWNFSFCTKIRRRAVTFKTFKLRLNWYNTLGYLLTGSPKKSKSKDKKLFEGYQFFLTASGSGDPSDVGKFES